MSGRGFASPELRNNNSWHGSERSSSRKEQSALAGKGDYGHYTGSSLGPAFASYRPKDSQTGGKGRASGQSKGLNSDISAGSKSYRGSKKGAPSSSERASGNSTSSRPSDVSRTVRRRRILSLPVSVLKSSCEFAIELSAFRRTRRASPMRSPSSSKMSSPGRELNFKPRLPVDINSSSQEVQAALDEALTHCSSLMDFSDKALLELHRLVAGAVARAIADGKTEIIFGADLRSSLGEQLTSCRNEFDQMRARLGELGLLLLPSDKLAANLQRAAEKAQLASGEYERNEDGEIVPIGGTSPEPAPAAPSPPSPKSVRESVDDIRQSIMDEQNSQARLWLAELKKGLHERRQLLYSVENEFAAGSHLPLGDLTGLLEELGSIDEEAVTACALLKTTLSQPASSLAAGSVRLARRLQREGSSASTDTSPMRESTTTNPLSVQDLQKFGTALSASFVVLSRTNNVTLAAGLSADGAMVCVAADSCLRPLRDAARKTQEYRRTKSLRKTEIDEPLEAAARQTQTPTTGSYASPSYPAPPGMDVPPPGLSAADRTSSFRLVPADDNESSKTHADIARYHAQQIEMHMAAMKALNDGPESVATTVGGSRMASGYSDASYHQSWAQMSGTYDFKLSGGESYPSFSSSGERTDASYGMSSYNQSWASLPGYEFPGASESWASPTHPREQRSSRPSSPGDQVAPHELMSPSRKSARHAAKHGLASTAQMESQIDSLASEANRNSERLMQTLRRYTQQNDEDVESKRNSSSSKGKGKNAKDRSSTAVKAAPAPGPCPQIFTDLSASDFVKRIIRLNGRELRLAEVPSYRKGKRVGVHARTLLTQILKEDAALARDYVCSSHPIAINMLCTTEKERDDAARLRKSVHKQLASRMADRIGYLERKCNLEVTVVFDGDFLPCKVEYEKRERKAQEEHVKSAVNGIQKFLLGGETVAEDSDLSRKNKVDQGFLPVLNHRFSPDLIHGVIAWARLLCGRTAFEVAPYESEAQLAWLFFAKKIDFVLSAENGLAVYQVPTFFLNSKNGFSFTDAGSVGVLLDSWWEGLKVLESEDSSDTGGRLHTWQDVLSCALLAGPCGRILTHMDMDQAIHVMLEILEDVKREQGEAKDPMVFASRIVEKLNGFASNSEVMLFKESFLAHWAAFRHQTVYDGKENNMRPLGYCPSTKEKKISTVLGAAGDQTDDIREVVASSMSAEYQQLCDEIRWNCGRFLTGRRLNYSFGADSKWFPKLASQGSVYMPGQWEELKRNGIVVAEGA